MCDSYNWSKMIARQQAPIYMQGEQDPAGAHPSMHGNRNTNAAGVHHFFKLLRKN